MQTSEIQREKVVAAVSEFLRNSDSPAVAQQHIVGTGATAAIEDKMRRYFGLPYAVAVCNATSGLLAAQVALGLQRSEIVTSSLSYGASVSGALFLRNRCVLADVDQHLNISPRSIRQRITPGTRAILAVDFNGVPADTQAVRALADEFGLWYIADAAQSFGAFRNGSPASCLADVAVTSFTLGKPLFAGEGAVILTRHSEVYERLIWHTQHPCRQRRELGLKFFNEFALNFRIHPLAAVWANESFNPSLQMVRHMQRYWLGKLSALERYGVIEPCGYGIRTVCPSFFRVVVRCKPGVQAKDIQKHLSTRRIEVREIRFIPLYRNCTTSTVYGPFISNSYCRNAEKLSKEALVVLSTTTPKEDL